MLCRTGSSELTLDQLMDELYPRIFRTFVNSNPALGQRADYYRLFLRNHDFSALLPDAKEHPLQVLEIGSGTGIGSANNARILSDMFNSGVQYIAIDKRKQLVDMTREKLSALNGTKSHSEVFIQDGLHNITQVELNKFGFIGKAHIYFAEHSIYSELFDFEKTVAYFNGVKNILKGCGLAFIVVLTEHTETQKLVGRHVKSTRDHAQHITNINKAVDMSGFEVVAKYLNPVRVTFPNLSNSEWMSIKIRQSDLECFASEKMKNAIELMTFINKPLNCLNDTELENYVDVLQSFLKQNNNTASNDEYIYVLSPTDCTAKKIDNDSKQHSNSVAMAAAHGFLRGVSHCVNQKLISKGVSKQFSSMLSQFTYYSGFFTMKFVSHYRAEANEVSCLNSLYTAAIETGQLMFVNSVLGLIDQLLAWKKRFLACKKHRPL